MHVNGVRLGASPRFLMRSAAQDDLKSACTPLWTTVTLIAAPNGTSNRTPLLNSIFSDRVKFFTRRGLAPFNPDLHPGTPDARQGEAAAFFAATCKR